jgi:cephalosporin hydroxylase
MPDSTSQDAIRAFQREVEERVAANATNVELREAGARFMRASTVPKYSYNFSWLGRPIIQYPQDIVAAQELIWQVRPDLIIETGIAHGGSLILSASMLALLDLCDAIDAGSTLDPRSSRRRVLGIDIDIRAHNGAAIAAHPMASRIQMIQGSSIDAGIVAQVRAAAAGYQRILVCLDSNHTHEHVYAELEAYAPLTSPGSYCIVFDTIIEDLEPQLLGARPWKPGNSPKTAVHRYLANHPEFEIDASMHDKLLITVAPEGFLKRVR